MTMYQSSGKETVELGGLRFVVMHRDVRDGNGGPSIEVYGDVDGKPVQVLRFDCFRKGPPYHYDPSNNREQHSLDAAQARDSVGWALGQVRRSIPEMLRSAGFHDLARSMDAMAVARGGTKGKAAVERTTPAPAKL